jgi:predicted ArsR family transcriptional regulator
MVGVPNLSGTAIRRVGSHPRNPSLTYILILESTDFLYYVKHYLAKSGGFATMEAMKVEADASGRDRILFQLKTKGPQTAAQMAKRMRVTPMAVRQHLYRLHEEGWVGFTDERRPVGRPARVWRLTEKAGARFPDSHADVTVELIQAARATFGERGLERLIAERTRNQMRGYRDRIPRRPALEQRVAALASIRSAEGYMAEWARERDGSFLLIENHCPICAAAQSCQGFCREELSLFRTVLGRDVAVERIDHILAGARRCAYRITVAHS